MYLIYFESNKNDNNNETWYDTLHGKLKEAT